MKNLLFLAIVLISSCAVIQPPTESPKLDESTWTLSAIEAKPVNFGDKAFLKFDELESKISGKAVCNSFFGEYERVRNKITFSGVGSTKMFCDGSMDEENQIITNLQRTNRYDIRLNMLYLYSGETLVLTYKR